MKTMFKNYFRPLACLGFFLSVLLTSQASWAQTWTGGAGDNKWSSAANWSPAVVPNLSTTNVTLGYTPTTTPYFITVDMVVQLNTLQISNAGVVLHLGNGGVLKLAGDLTVNAGAFMSASHPSGQLVMNGTLGLTSQTIDANGGVVRVPSFVLDNTSTNKNITIKTGTTLSLDGYDASFATVLLFNTASNVLNVPTGATVEVAPVAGSPTAFISIPTGTGSVTGTGAFTLGATTKLDPSGAATTVGSTYFFIEPNLTLNYYLSVPPSSPVFDIGYNTLKLGGDFTNNVLSGGSSATLGTYAQLEFGKISGDQTYTGTGSLEVARLYVNKSADKIVLNGDVHFKFTTVGTYDPLTHALLEFATGSNSEVEIGASKTLRFTTSGFVSAGATTNGIETVMGSKVTGAGNVVIDNFPTATTNAITVTMKSDLIVDAALTIKNGHVLDLNANTLALAGNLVSDGFITSTTGDGILRFKGATVQTVSNTLTTVAIPMPRLEFAKTAGSVTFSNSLELRGPNSNPTTTNTLSFITFKENTASKTNAVDLTLAANQLMTVSAAGAFTVQTGATGKIIGGSGSGVTFYTASHLGSDFTIQVPFTSISNYDVNIGQYKLTLGGHLGTTTDVTASGNAYITATDFTSAQLIFAGTSITPSEIGAFITGLPNVKVLSGVQVDLLGNINFYGSDAAAPSFISTLHLVGTLNLNDKFMTVSGLSPQIGLDGSGNISDLADNTSHGGVFVSGNNTFLTITTSATVSAIDLGKQVDLVIGEGSGIGMNSRNIILRGDFTNASTASTVFHTASSTSTETVIFADNTNGKGNFATVTGNVEFPRLAVQKTNTVPTSNCFASTDLSGAVNIGSTFVTLTGTSGDVLDMTNTGVIYMNGGGINKINDGGNVKFGASYSFITGSGSLFFTGFTTLSAGDLVSQGPAIGIAADKTLTIATGAKLSVGGDLIGGNIDGEGAVRFIGGSFQTVTIGFLPGMIIDKCPTGPFMTVAQSTTNLVLGKSGLTIESGVLAMNTAIFTSGNVLVKAGANNFITTDLTITDGTTPMTFSSATSVLVFNTLTNLTVEDQDGTFPIASMAMRYGGNVTMNSHVALVGGAVGCAFYSALDMQDAGNLVMNGKNLTFQGGGQAAAFQSGAGIITGSGNVYVTATNVHFVTTPVRGTAYSFRIDQANVYLQPDSRLAMDGGVLSLGGNFYNDNTFVNAFITSSDCTGEAAGNEKYGMLHMTGATPTIGGSAAGIYIPALKVDGALTVGVGSAGTGFINLTQYYGTTDATGQFQTVLEFAGSSSSIALNDRFLTISGEGITKANGGYITGGQAANGVSFTKNIEGAQNSMFVTGVLNIPTAGVVVSQGPDAHIMWDDRYIYDLKLGGNLTNEVATTQSIFFDATTPANAYPSDNHVAARNSVIRFTGSALTTVSNLTNFPNFQMEKSVDMLVQTAAAGDFVRFEGSGNTSSINKLALTGAGNLLFDANSEADLNIAGATQTNNGTVAQTGTGIVRGDATRKFYVSGTGQSSFVSVASSNFTVSGFGAFQIGQGEDSRVHLAGDYSGATTGATLTLGVTSLYNTAVGVYDAFGNSYQNAPNGDVLGVAAHQYAGFDKGLVLMSATSPNQIQMVGNTTNLIHFPRFKALGYGTSFSTVSFLHSGNVNHSIIGNGGNTVLELDRSVLMLDDGLMNQPNAIRIYNNGTAGSISQSNGGFISAACVNTDANQYEQAVIFVEPTTIASDFLFDKTSVIIRNGKTVTANGLVQIGGSLSGNTLPPYGSNLGFSATPTAGTGVAGTGTVEFISACPTLYNLSGIATLPRLSINTNGDVRTATSPGQLTSVTQGTADALGNDALTFKTGRFILGIDGDANFGVNELDLTGTSANIRNDIVGYQPMFNTVGSVKFSGAGESKIYTGVAGAGASETSVQTVTSTAFPKLVVFKPVGTQVKLETSIFITAEASLTTLPTLVLSQGDMDLNGNNILLAYGALMSEDMALDYNIYDSKATLGPDYSRSGGNIFATSVNVGNSATPIAGTGLILSNGAAGANYPVDVIRRHGVGNGSLDMVTAAVNRYYYVTVANGTTPTIEADALTSIIYPNSELNGIMPSSLNLLRFLTADPAGVYESGGGTAGTNNVSLSNPTINFTTGYLTLGSSQINLFTTIRAGETVTDAREDLTTTPAYSAAYGAYRLVYTKVGATPPTITLKVVPSALRNATSSSTNTISDNFGTDGDYFLSQDGNDPTPLAIDGSGNFSLTLPANSYQTFITVRPKYDEVPEGNEFVTVQLTSGATGLPMGVFTTAFVNIIDNDIPGFEVQFVTTAKNINLTNRSVDGYGTVNKLTDETLYTSEFMSAEMFGVVLNLKPSANVYMQLANSDATEGTLSTSFITFTPANWNVFQTVTLTGVDDPEFDLVQNYFISVSVANGSAAEYWDPSTLQGITGMQTSLKSVVVKAQNADNEVAISFITTFEHLGADRYLTEDTPYNQALLNPLRLSSTFTIAASAKPKPGASITINLNPSSPRLLIAPNQYIITEANWNIPQTITLTPLNDAIDDDDLGVTITPTFSTWGDVAIYESTLAIPFISVRDDDTAGIVDQISDASLTNLTENIVGKTSDNGAYRLLFVTTTEDGRLAEGVGYKLRTQPASPVTLFVSAVDMLDNTRPSNVAHISVGAFTTISYGVQLVFDATNWNTFQSVVIIGETDNRIAGDRLVHIYHRVASTSNAKYAPLAVRSYVVKNQDNGRETTTGGGGLPGPDDGSGGGTNRLTAPSGLTVRAGNRVLVVTWAPNPEPNVTYEICYWASGIAERCVQTTATSINLTGLINGKTYSVRIKAHPTNNPRVFASDFTSPVQGYPSIVLANGEDDIESKLNVYPNPSDGSFTLKLSNVNTTRMSIHVTDVAGRQIFTKDFGKTTGEFQADLMMTNMPAGIYLLSVDTDNGTYRTRLMLVKNR